MRYNLKIVQLEHVRSRVLLPRLRRKQRAKSQLIRTNLCQKLKSKRKKSLIEIIVNAATAGLMETTILAKCIKVNSTARVSSHVQMVMYTTALGMKVNSTARVSLRTQMVLYTKAPGMQIISTARVSISSQKAMFMMAPGIKIAELALVYSLGRMVTKNKVSMTAKIKDKEFIFEPLLMAPNSRYYTKTMSKLVNPSQCECNTERIEVN